MSSIGGFVVSTWSRGASLTVGPPWLDARRHVDIFGPFCNTFASLFLE